MLDKELVKKRNEKSIKTNNLKYGVDNPMKIDSVKMKKKETNILKYGVDCYTKSEDYKTKIIKHNNEKYKKNWYFQSDDYKEKMKNKEHHTKSLVFQEIRKEKNIKKWGVENFSQTIAYKDIMNKYYNSSEFIINKEIEINNNKNKIFDYYSNYEKNCHLLNILNDKLSFNCFLCKNNFDINKQLLYLRKKENKVICLNCNPILIGTSGKEIEIYNFIKENYLGEIITNSRSIINPLELDIYLPDVKLAFEFNGLYWHSELYKDKGYHLNKTKLCLEKNIVLIHIFEDDWEFKSNIVKSMILNKLGKSNRIFARKTEIREVIDNKIVRYFLESNHIQGFVGSKIKLGLYYNNELVSLMTFGNLRVFMNNKAKDGSYELLRFVNKLNTAVVGGASKLFSYFIKNYNYTEIISYSDYSRSVGNMYKNLNFNLNHLSEPNYYWIKDGIRHYRYNFRKDKLIKEGYDPKKSENVIMIERGYVKLYDCGVQKWIYK